MIKAYKKEFWQTEICNVCGEGYASEEDYDNRHDGEHEPSCGYEKGFGCNCKIEEMHERCVARYYRERASEKVEAQE